MVRHTSQRLPSSLTSIASQLGSKVHKSLQAATSATKCNVKSTPSSPTSVCVDARHAPSPPFMGQKQAARWRGAYRTGSLPRDSASILLSHLCLPTSQCGMGATGVNSPSSSSMKNAAASASNSSHTVVSGFQRYQAHMESLRHCE